MVNIPASPQEKLYVRLEQAQAQGKAFDETLERRVIGLPPVDGRAPIIIPESRERQLLTRKEDLEGRQELADEAKAATAVELQKKNSLLEAQLAEMQAQMAELTGKRPSSVPDGPRPAAPAAPVGGRTVEVPEGLPNLEWTRQQMKEFLAREGLAPLARNGFGMTKTAVLDHVAAELAKKGGAP